MGKALLTRATHRSVWSKDIFSDGGGGDAHDIGNKLWVKHLRQHFLRYKHGVSLLQQLQVGRVSVIGVYTLRAASKKKQNTSFFTFNQVSWCVCVCAAGLVYMIHLH